MTKLAPSLTRFRRLTIAAVSAWAMGHLPSAAVSAPAAVPAAIVAGVEPSRVADLVLLGRGYDAGLRAGMVCRISRGPTEIGEVLLVELRPTCCSALILSLAPAQSIRPGDLATVKIQKS